MSLLLLCPHGFQLLKKFNLPNQVHYFKMTHLPILKLNLIKCPSKSSQETISYCHSELPLPPNSGWLKTAQNANYCLRRCARTWGVQPGIHCPTRGTTLQKSSRPRPCHGLWSSSQKYSTENVDITPESSFAHLIQLLLNAHIRPAYTERAELRIGFLRYWLRGFPGSPVGKMPRSQCRGPWFDPWSGTKSLCAATKKAACRN